MSIARIKRELLAQKDPQKAAFFPRFFKTGVGEYGHGDIFIGVTVPQVRTIVKKYANLSLSDIETLLADPIHEYRLTALLILVAQYQKADEKRRQEIVTFYLQHTNNINNWDLVDASAYHILGASLIEKKTTILTKLARSKNLWEQRIAIVATLAFIRVGKLDETLRIALLLLHHPHDLIHKAVGWMLREVGKQDERVLRSFLDQHAKTMPRTMLRYAIERLDTQSRTLYMRRL